MIFIDSNIPMYLIGAPHPNKERILEILPRLVQEDGERFIRRLLGFVQIAETTTGHLNYAVELDMSDFEDAMQVAAAQACGPEHIVTRNIRDYVGSAYQPLRLGKR